VALVGGVVVRQRGVVEERVLVGVTEGADLGVQVAQVRDLEGLRELAEDDLTVAAEEARAGDAVLGVAVAVGDVAGGAGEQRLAGEEERLVVEEEVAAGLLVGVERVVER